MEDAVVIGKEELRSTHTRAPEVRGEVLSGPERRRRWSTEEKLRVLAHSVAPGSSPSLTVDSYTGSAAASSILGVSGSDRYEEGIRRPVSIRADDAEAGSSRWRAVSIPR